MSQEKRTCRNCGAKIPAGERECPSCGRLYVDRQKARFRRGADFERGEPSVHSAKEPSASPPKRGEEEKPSGDKAKTDSYYSIAPRFEEPEDSEAPCKGCTGAIILAILLPLLSALLIL